MTKSVYKLAFLQKTSVYCRSGGRDRMLLLETRKILNKRGTFRISALGKPWPRVNPCKQTKKQRAKSEKDCKEKQIFLILKKTMNLNLLEVISSATVTMKIGNFYCGPSHLTSDRLDRDLFSSYSCWDNQFTFPCFVRKVLPCKGKPNKLAFPLPK